MIGVYWRFCYNSKDVILTIVLQPYLLTIAFARIPDFQLFRLLDDLLLYSMILSTSTFITPHFLFGIRE